jgi:peptidase A4-like protein
MRIQTTNHSAQSVSGHAGTLSGLVNVARRIIMATAALAISAPLIFGISAAQMDTAPASAATFSVAKPDAASASSTMWAGYIVNQGLYSSVTSSWTQPTVKSGSSPAYAYLWAGIDGWSGRAKDTIEQVGTGAESVNGHTEYWAWWEMFPGGPQTFSNAPVTPGDQFASSVTYRSGQFTLTLTDITQGWTRSVTKSGSAYRTSAEVIAEAPTNVLANFGSATFHGITVNGSSMKNPFPVTLKMNQVLATVSAFRGNSFTATWRNSR